jgi:hypothetical protein
MAINGEIYKHATLEFLAALYQAKQDEINNAIRGRREIGDAIMGVMLASGLKNHYLKDGRQIVIQRRNDLPPFVKIREFEG